MTVHLPPGIERIVEEAVHSGRYRSAKEVLSEAVSVWQARHTAAEPTGNDRQAAIERLKNFGKVHRLSLGGITISSSAMRRARELDCPGCLGHALLVFP